MHVSLTGVRQDRLCWCHSDNGQGASMVEDRSVVGCWACGEEVLATFGCRDRVGHVAFSHHDIGVGSTARFGGVTAPGDRGVAAAWAGASRVKVACLISTLKCNTESYRA